ncbi:uncharacterized protein MKK02DRAFT_23631 [Dioszegia hungarica]|uniref:Transmembrane protein n=1 Tax=Dioszegia hungarica TaxID=4972 RepID=A0AA38LWF6_9TREE|nr:uncharacterized protein MKK02DRAFT_23631 [Dioszegia hungarica]KAI9637648.1 hypothetical protein MKK02DRAFT_23631 [Dioszegia hungarica]
MSAVFQDDPYLQYQPSFAYTLPIQLFVNGITITLLCVLFIHLMFTAQYHYPLAPLNYILQFSSVLVCLISVIIKVVVVLSSASDNGDTWPYSLIYVAVPIPPSWWNTAQDSFWFLLQALCVGLSNITHIHFLTLLYPSRTEARLIIFLLGPLAIASSGLVFVALSNNQTALDIGDAIRNTLNSTLLLIFTIALLMWGLVVNRRRAWRNDGGTAIFGIGSLSLAIISTTFNFVAIAEDGIDWLQHLLFAAVLWQIWLGWWWWVGSGMGIGEVEDIMQKAERKKRKAAKRAARLRATSGLGKRTKSIQSSAVDIPSAAANAVSGLTSSVTGILRNRSMRSNSGLRRRRSETANTGSLVGDVEEGIEMGTIGSGSRAGTGRVTPTIPPAAPQRVGFTPDTDASRLQPSTNSETSSTSRTPSLHPPRTVRQFFSFPTTWLQVYIRQLRHAHEDATKRQVMQRAEVRQRVFARDGAGEESASRSSGPRRGSATRLDNVGEEEAEVEEGVGWGLGSFGIKEHEASARRLREAGDLLREGRLLGDEERRALAEDAAGREGGADGQSEWEDIDSDSSSGDLTDEEGSGGRRTGKGWSWWGPLKNWRRTDRSDF